jgi:thiaminase
MTKTYTDKLRSVYPELWATAGSSEFISQLKKGTLPMDKFRNYSIQKYSFMKFYKRFLGVLVAKFPHYYDLVGGELASVMIGSMIAEKNTDELFIQIKKELKITNVSIHPSPATKGLSDFLLSVAYNQTYKDALVCIVALKTVHDQYLSTPTSQKINPIFSEDIATCATPESREFMEWAERSLNQIMANDTTVTKKHEHVLLYALQWLNMYLRALQEPEILQWPIEVENWA